MPKSKKIQVEGEEITILFENGNELISLTDMLKAKDGNFFISDWLRNRNTIEYLGIWESIYNPSFNYGEFATIKSQAGLNSFKLSVKDWTERTNAIGLKATAGRYGATFAHPDIATNDTLTVSYVTFANNNQPFRCIVSSRSCSDTSNVAVLTVNNNVGINEISANQLFSVYPNPTSTIINLKSDVQLLGATYFMYDNLGKTILSGKITSENMPIDLNQPAEGNYLIGIDANGVNSKKQSFKVIK